MMVCVGSGSNDRKRTAKLSRSATDTAEVVKVEPGLKPKGSYCSPLNAFDK